MVSKREKKGIVMKGTFYVKHLGNMNETPIIGDNCHWVEGVFQIRYGIEVVAEFNHGIAYWYFEKSGEHDEHINED